MKKIILFVAILAATVTAGLCEVKYYWDYPTTTLEPTDRVLVYKGYSTAGRDRNVTGEELGRPLGNYTSAHNAVLGNYTTTNNAEIATITSAFTGYTTSNNAAVTGNHSQFTNYTSSPRAVLRQQATFGNVSTSSLRVYGSTTGNYATIDAGINISQVTAPAPAPTATVQALAGNVDIGDHRYTVTYITPLGETGLNKTVGTGGITQTITTSAGNQQVILANIPVSSDYRVTGRKIYRTKIAPSSIYHFYPLATLDATTTTYTDNTADASLGAISGTGIWYGVNTTNKQILLNNAKAMTIDPLLTTFGSGAGAAGAYGGQNTLIGASAGDSITSGDNNTMLGNSAGQNGSTMQNNTCLGGAACYQITGSYTTVVGANALYTAVAKSSNTVIGASSGFNSTGASNIFLGFQSGYNETGDSKLIIDNQSHTNEATQRTNAIIYGVMAATPASQTLALNAAVSATQGLTTPSITTAAADSKLLIGSASAYDEAQTRLGIGTTSPSAPLHVVGDAQIDGSITTTSSTGNGVSLSDLGYRSKGTATTWDDLHPIVMSNAAKSVANYPNCDAALTTNIKACTFAANDYVNGSTEITHNHKDNSNMEWHIHMVNSGAETADKTVRYEITYWWENLNGTATTTEYVADQQFVIPAGTADRKHLYFDFTEEPIDGSAITIGAYIVARFRRLAITSGTAPTNDPFVLAIGIHHEIDSLGSDNEHPPKTATP